MYGTASVDESMNLGTIDSTIAETPGPIAAPSAIGTFLVVDDEDGLREMIAEELALAGHRVIAVGTLAAALKTLETESIDVVTLDLSLPDGSGLDLLKVTSDSVSEPSVLVVTGDTSADTAVQALKGGAVDFISKPFDLDAFINRAGNALNLRLGRDAKALQQRTEQLRSNLSSGLRLPSPVMSTLMDKLSRVAARDGATVLLTGETGVGKEVIARMVHELSPRASEQFVAVNCANLDRNLLQSELFGHEKGAFTGASERRKGLFELASSGTLFLDELGEIPLETQAAFLRVLETRKFRRVGGSTEIQTRTRVVAATNKDLEQMARDGEFREDLLYRLNVVEFRIPPLRERLEDVPVLAQHFCKTIGRSMGVKAEFTKDALDSMMGHSWRGNIRELRNMVERTLIVCGDGPIGSADLELRHSGEVPGSSITQQTSNQSAPSLDSEPLTPDGDLTLEAAVQKHIQRVLDLTGGNKSRAADLLGIARNTLLRRMNPDA